MRVNIPTSESETIINRDKIIEIIVKKVKIQINHIL